MRWHMSLICIVQRRTPARTLSQQRGAPSLVPRATCHHSVEYALEKPFLALFHQPAPTPPARSTRANDVSPLTTNTAAQPRARSELGRARFAWILGHRLLNFSRF